MTALKGIYLLLLRLDAELADLQVGRLGRYRCAAGHYLYVGSAFGPGGLAARLAHHERPAKARPHWHIDYLRAQARLIEAWAVGSTLRRECCWARALAAEPGLSIPIPGFGATDNGCISHLLYSPSRPALRLLTETLLGCLAREGSQDFTLEITSYEGA
ncbi:MAG: GIY-YIG nuclease family protein [Kouleothrix sp.]|nr:GIY-YIG nuclease family protein [Kouleothrix sp.]